MLRFRSSLGYTTKASNLPYVVLPWLVIVPFRVQTLWRSIAAKPVVSDPCTDLLVQRVLPIFAARVDPLRSPLTLIDR